MTGLAFSQVTPPLAHERADTCEKTIMESSPNPQLEPVRPTRPAAAYIGGKRQLSGRLVERINRIDHQIYAEPFVGMGGVFFRRDRRPRAEAINDRSMNVANFFRILQRHYVAFMDMLRFQLTTRAGFERLRATDPTTLTDLERAARFLYLQRTAFGGKVAGQSFGINPAGPARFDITKLGPILEALHERLAPVTIECLDWPDFIRRYDRPGTLFYLDPPYYECEDDYGRDDRGEALFDRSQFERLAETLAGLKGRFVMSLNDRPEVRAIFAAFAVEKVRTNYTLAGNNNAKNVGELIISSNG